MLHRSLLAGITALVLLVPSTSGHLARARPATAADHHVAAIEGRTPNAFPEGVTWDPTRQAFLVGSIRTGRIDIVTRAGEVRPLITRPPGVSTFGLHADVRRGRLLVTYADIGFGERSSAETMFKQTGVAVYDLRTGRLLRRVDLNTPKLNPAGGPHGVNDLAVDALGNAYVTDPPGDAIYRIDPAGRPSVLLRDARLDSDSVGANGIVWSPEGYLLTVRYDTGGLLRISLPSATLSEVQLPTRLVGGDGLALTGGNRLLVVTNKLSAPGTEAVTTLSSDDGYRSAQTVATTAWPVPAPTTVALSPGGAYALSGGLDLMVTGELTDRFTLRRVP